MPNEPANGSSNGRKSPHVTVKLDMRKGEGAGICLEGAGLTGVEYNVHNAGTPYSSGSSNRQELCHVTIKLV